MDDVANWKGVGCPMGCVAQVMVVVRKRCAVAPVMGVVKLQDAGMILLMEDPAPPGMKKNPGK